MSSLFVSGVANKMHSVRSYHPLPNQDPFDTAGLPRHSRAAAAVNAFGIIPLAIRHGLADVNQVLFTAFLTARQAAFVFGPKDPSTADQCCRCS